MTVGGSRLRYAALLVLLAGTAAWAENTDPGNDGSQWAWSENAGWVNASPPGMGAPASRWGTSR
jgi:hypothetical protein